MTVVVPELRCRRLTPAVTDLLWNGDAFRDILSGDALGERAIGAVECENLREVKTTYI